MESQAQEFEARARVFNARAALLEQRVTGMSAFSADDILNNDVLEDFTSQ